MWKSIGKWTFVFCASFSLGYNLMSIGMYYSVEHPTREEKYLELLSTRGIYSLNGAPPYVVLDDQELEYCNAQGGCAVVGLGELEAAISSAYAEGQRTKIGNHD